MAFGRMQELYISGSSEQGESDRLTIEELLGSSCKPACLKASELIKYTVVSCCFFFVFSLLRDLGTKEQETSVKQDMTKSRE